MNDRLPSKLWIDALLRRVSVAGSFGMIVHVGDADRGDVLVKTRCPDGQSQVYAPAFSMDGPRTFEPLFREDAFGDEAAIDEIIARRRASDGDVWVVEIEDKEGRHFLTEPVRTPEF